MSYTFYNLPSDPRAFKCKFFTCYYDNDGNQQASSPFSHVIELETVVENKTMTLQGTATKHTHQAYVSFFFVNFFFLCYFSRSFSSDCIQILPLDNHEHDVSFSVASRNRHKAIHDQIFWRKYLSAKEMKDALTEKTIQIKGVI